MMAGMQAMVLDAPRTPLILRERPVPAKFWLRSRPAGFAARICMWSTVS
jgi:hypothetical protein